MNRITVTLILMTLASLATAAGPAFWDSPEIIAFTDGELEGAAIDPNGSLVPGLMATPLLADSSLVFWSVAAADDGTVFAASGHEGRVWRIDRNGDASLLADLPAEEVFAVLPDAGGAIAGCGPGGQIYAIDEDGGATLVGTIPGGYAWDLERAPDGTVYIAAGTPAAVYAITSDGLEQVVELPASNALDLAVMDDGSLLVAAQGPGRVFHVIPDSNRWALMLAMDQDEGRQVVQGPDGWYALGYQGEDSPGESDLSSGMSLSNPFDIMVTADAQVQQVRSALYRLDGPTPSRVWGSEHVITSVAWSGDHGWLGAGARDMGRPATLYVLDAPNQRRPVANWEGGDVVQLVMLDRADDPDVILAAQAHPGQIASLTAARKDEAVAMGPPLDGKLPVQWGRLAWRGPAGGSEPRFAVRSGNSPTPDTSWTDWVDLGRGRDLDLKDVPPTRSLQWRVTLSQGSRVDAVTVSAVAPNLAPIISHFEIQPNGEIYQGGMMQPAPNVTQNLGQGLQLEYSISSRRDRRLDRSRAGTLRPLRALTYHASDPNEDRLVYRAFHRQQGQADWLPIDGATVEQVQTWDTATLPDGWYDLRLEVSDRVDNPNGQAASAERVIGPVPVDNTEPELKNWKLEFHRDGFTLQLEAKDEFGALAGAEIELPDGQVERLDPEDGVCDEAGEKFNTTVRFPRNWSGAAPRPWSVTVRVWDRLGNVAHVTGVLP